jgi:AraC family transcriptional regulator
MLAPAFRIETHGPDLPSRSSLYGAGDARCFSDPGRRIESSYAFSSIGVVVSGRFDYASPVGPAQAGPGTVLLGNAGEDFEYRYQDAAGVRRSVMALDGRLLAEVANDFGHAGFPVSALPAGRATAPVYAAVRRFAAGHAADEEALVRLAAACLMAGAAPAPVASTRRIREIAALIDERPEAPLGLSDLAGLVGLSRYHFIRAFRATVGETPRQYQIAARLRAAADLLVDTRAPITGIAFDAGFNDLSHFNATFRRAFGASPRAWRSAA